MSDFDQTFVRKTDDSIIVNLSNSDNSNLTAGTWTIYLTVRSQKPLLSESDDTGALIQKTVTVNVPASTTTASGTITFSQTDLDIETGTYLYDIKVNDPNNSTFPLISDGFAKFTIVSDITRRNT